MKKNISKVLTAVISLLSVNLMAEEATLVERYPIRNIDRPGIMPVDISQFDTKLGMEALKKINLSTGITFGVAKSWQGQVSYSGVDFNTRATNADEVVSAKRTVILGTKYNYFGASHVSMSASASLPIHIWDGEIVQDITLGLPITFYNNLMAGGIFGDIFKITMRPKTALEINFKFWYGIQICDSLWASVNSSFGKLYMDEKGDKFFTATGFWNKGHLPAELELTYAFNHYFDLTGNFGFENVFTPKETMMFGLTFSARAGRLFS